LINFYHRFKASGYADVPSQKVTGVASIDSITPSTGSIHGGTEVHILGNGFTSSTTVNFDTVACEIIDHSINSIVCITGEHAAATASANIRYFMKLIVFKLYSQINLV